MEQYGVDVERKKIILPEDVKDLGTYTLTLKLHAQVIQEMEMDVAQD
jgi:large subunit ribosomal protein L9